MENQIDGLYRADLCLALLAGNYVISTWTGWRNIPFEWMTLPYMVVCFGRMSLPDSIRAGVFSTSPRKRCGRFLRPQDIERDKRSAILRHGSSSLREARLGSPEQPSLLYRTKGGPPGLSPGT